MYLQTLLFGINLRVFLNLNENQTCIIVNFKVKSLGINGTVIKGQLISKYLFDVLNEKFDQEYKKWSNP